MREVLFDGAAVEETQAVEEGVLTRDQFFEKVPQRPMSAHGIEMCERYLEDPKGFKF